MSFSSVSMPPWTAAVHLAPNTLDDWGAELFTRRLLTGYEAPAVTFSEPEGQLVTGERFAVISATRGLLPESIYIMPHLRWTEVFDGVGSFIAYANHTCSPALIAGNAGHTNYYHWLLQSVATMLVERRRTGPATPFVVPCMSNWRRNTLELFGIDNPLVEVPLDGGLALNFGYVCNLTAGDYAFAPHPQVLDLFRSRGAQVAGARRRERRLYLERGAASSNRPLANEPAVVTVLARHGFEIVSPGDLPLIEQITLFREAALIVAPHGAALTNLVWVEDGADGPAVVELMQANYLNRCFAKLAQAKQLDYTVLINRHQPTNDHHHRSTWEVDLPLLAETLSL